MPHRDAWTDRHEDGHVNSPPRQTMAMDCLDANACLESECGRPDALAQQCRPSGASRKQAALAGTAEANAFTKL